MSDVVMLSEENFAEVVRDNDKLVLIDFYADWCGPCRMFAPVFAAAASSHDDVVFSKVDTEAAPGLAAAFSISSIPTLVAIKDNTVLYASPGALTAPMLDSLIEQLQLSVPAN